MFLLNSVLGIIIRQNGVWLITNNQSDITHTVNNNHLVVEILRALERSRGWLYCTDISSNASLHPLTRANLTRRHWTYLLSFEERSQETCTLTHHYPIYFTLDFPALLPQIPLSASAKNELIMTEFLIDLHFQRGLLRRSWLKSSEKGRVLV